MTQWEVKEDLDAQVHVVPLEDLREHVLRNCWCSPTIDEDSIVIHNALDEREKFERGERKPS